MIKRKNYFQFSYNFLYFDLLSDTNSATVLDDVYLLGIVLTHGSQQKQSDKFNFFCSNLFIFYWRCYFVFYSFGKLVILLIYRVFNIHSGILVGQVSFTQFSWLTQLFKNNNVQCILNKFLITISKSVYNQGIRTKDKTLPFIDQCSQLRHVFHKRNYQNNRISV